MKKFVALAVVASLLSLSMWTTSAHAQRGGSRGGSSGGGSRGGSYHGGSYGGNSYRGGYYGGNGYRGGYYGGLGVGVYVGGSPYYGGYGSNYYDNGPTYYTPTYYYGSSGVLTGAAPSINYSSGYSPPETNNAATIHVLVPDANARVYFDQTLTQQTGTDRLFTSPALDAGQTFLYTIKATWMENGKEVTRSSDVRVQGGHATMVDFSK